MPSGFILTILVANQMDKADREDTAFSGTAKKIYDYITIFTTIPNPVDPSEDMRKRITEPQMSNFKEKLKALKDNASEALKEEKKEKACKKWKKEFGDRWPSCDNLKEDDETAKKTAAPAILRDDARSA